MPSKALSAALASAVVTSLLVGVVHVLHAEATSFTPGETLSSSKMNASFLAISNRLDALEKANASSAQMVPSGTIVAYGGGAAPEGWLLCDGTAVDRVAEPTLFSAIGTAWGAPDETKFNVPDLRGRFLRGLDGEANRDPDRDGRPASAPGGNAGNKVGSIEGDQLRAHTHDSAYFNTGPIVYSPQFVAAATVITTGTTVPTTAAGGNETRPANANVAYIIKR